MLISKLNNGVGIGDDADQSEIARVFALKNATHSIKISQQVLFFKESNYPLLNKILRVYLYSLFLMQNKSNFNFLQRIFLFLGHV